MPVVRNWIQRINEEILVLLSKNKSNVIHTLSQLTSFQERSKKLKYHILLKNKKKCIPCSFKSPNDILT